MILMKAIKPSRLKDKVMRLTLLNAMRRAATALKKDFEGTTATWKRKPKFEALISLKKPGPTILIGTDSEVWNWIDQGTGLHGPRRRKYEIWAGIYTGKSQATVLAFPSAFEPKTKPGSLRSGSGYKGPVDTFRPYVLHPGIEPREFSEQIAKNRKRWFKRQMQEAMKQAAKASGYGL